jgi:predicted nucleic acid-binding protein
LLVLDANVVLPACASDDGFARFSGEPLAAPPLMWSEVLAALHLGLTRGIIDREGAELSLQRLEGSPISTRSPRALRHEAWRIADDLGMGRTYDAEYLALASLLGCRLVTLDGRLRRGADRLGLVIGPGELER